MRRSSSVLILVLPLAVGCGRLGFGELEPGTNETGGVDENSPLAPSQCEAVDAFATLASGDMNVAAAATPTGASLFFVPSAGGDLSGIDVALDRQAGPVTLVRAGSFTESAAAYLDGRLVATARTGSRSLVHDVPMPIGAGTEIGNFGGDHMTKNALVHAGPDRVLATSCSAISLHAFDAGWSGTESTYYRDANPSDHLDIVQLGARAFTAMSTQAGCQYETATDRATSTARISSVNCLEARMATDDVDQVAMAFSNTGDIELVIDRSDTVSAANALPIGVGSAPRVLRHDGRYWISYLDQANHVVIGYVDQGIVLTRTLADATTTAGAYELAIYDGAPWIFAVDPGTAKLYGRGLCAR
jgi:hypothetical protein